MEMDMHVELSAGCRGALGRIPSDGLAFRINWGLKGPGVSRRAHSRVGVKPEVELNIRLSMQLPFYVFLKNIFCLNYL